MAHAGRAHRLPLAAGELEDELALVLGFGLEDGEGAAEEGEAPVDEGCAGVVCGDGDGLEQGVEGVEGDGCERGGEHGGDGWGEGGEREFI